MMGEGIICTFIYINIYILLSFLCDFFPTDIGVNTVCYSL